MCDQVATPNKTIKLWKTLPQTQCINSTQTWNFARTSKHSQTLFLRLGWATKKESDQNQISFGGLESSPIPGLDQKYYFGKLCAWAIIALTLWFEFIVVKQQSKYPKYHEQNNLEVLIFHWMDYCFHRTLTQKTNNLMLRTFIRISHHKSLSFTAQKWNYCAFNGVFWWMILVFNDQKVKKHLPQSSNLELHNDRLNWLEVNTQCFLLNIMSLVTVLHFAR